MKLTDQLVKAYISRSALRHNIRLIQGAAGNTPLCPMVKAAAYGHGVALVVKSLAGIRIPFWGVATLNEALELRQLAVRAPIVVMRPLTMCAPEKSIREQIRLMRRLGIRPTLAGDDTLKLIAQTAANSAKPLRAHVKVDTGMGRNGCPAGEAPALALKIKSTRGLALEGFYSHFATASADNLDFAREQLAVFNSILANLTALGIRIPLRHLANSAAIYALPGTRFDLVRPGQALYGYSVANSKASRRLAPALRIEAPVLFTKWIRKGATCGYGRTFRARRATRIGLLPFGYGDGYSRRWSNAGAVDFRGRLAPVIGRISMDLTMVDLTDMPEAATGAMICVLSNRRPDPHSIESMAARLGTVPHEIGCALGNRIQRVLVE